jgi:hypothetical protein
MTQQHPITPPPELVEQWYDAIDNQSTAWKQQLATRAAQWGADQKLEATLIWLVLNGHGELCHKIRAARRTKPKSLKEQALNHFESFSATFETSGGDSDLIRRAIESIPDPS